MAIAPAHVFFMEATNTQNMPPRAAIFGVTGFIGRGLPALLADAGLSVTGVSRSGGAIPGVGEWRTPETFDPAGHRIVINLAGEPVARRWTSANRQRFHESRVTLTRRLVESIRALPPALRPEVLVNASAVGFFGDRGDEELSDSASVGEGYLASLCAEWEVAAAEAEALGVRVVRARFGLVLGRGGEATEKLMRVFKAGLGGRLGSGRQWMPWIHVQDARSALIRAATDQNLTGPLNITAPAPAGNADFTRKLAAALHRPAVLHVPGFALRLALGGFGGALLSSQRALPDALVRAGFSFRYPTLESALADLTENG